MVERSTVVTGIVKVVTAVATTYAQAVSPVVPVPSLGAAALASGVLPN